MLYAVSPHASEYRFRIRFPDCGDNLLLLNRLVVPIFRPSAVRQSVQRVRITRSRSLSPPGEGDGLYPRATLSSLKLAALQNARRRFALFHNYPEVRWWT